jgi:outer membrane protein OmpA-like peptidoglycan-associated protein
MPIRRRKANRPRFGKGNLKIMFNRKRIRPSYHSAVLHEGNSHLGLPAHPASPQPARTTDFGNRAFQTFAQFCPHALPSPALCPFGGACHACPVRAQAKLEVSQPNDPSEQEADRVAEQVMTMPEPKVQRVCPSCEEDTVQKKPLAEGIAPLVHRQEQPDEEEEPVQAKSAEEGLQRQGEPEQAEDQEQPVEPKREGGNLPRLTPGGHAQIQSLRGGGAPLAPSTRGFFEQRFGNNFEDVRIHSGPQAAQAAKAVRAQAFTLGRDIVFGQNRYAPESPAGQKLLAHELAHTVQQRGTKALHRKVVVQDPWGKPPKAPAGETNENIIRNYVTTLCPDFAVASGKLVPTGVNYCPTGAAASSTPTSCTCLCTMHTHKKPSGAPVTWSVVVDDLKWPETDEKTKTISIQSPYSGLEFGAWSKGNPSHRVHADNWLVFGHEICGHGSLYARGMHPASMPLIHGGSPGHDPMVNIQNDIAREHGIPASEERGTFIDPHHGESFSKVTVRNYPFGKFQVGYLPVDERRKLDTAAAFLSKASVKADVIGHADHPTANPSANITTSRYRAWGVRQDLVMRGIAPSRFLYTDGVGASECPLPGNQPSCRKVEIFMFGQHGASITHPYP